MFLYIVQYDSFKRKQRVRGIKSIWTNQPTNNKKTWTSSSKNISSLINYIDFGIWKELLYNTFFNYILSHFLVYFVFSQAAFWLNIYIYIYEHFLASKTQQNKKKISFSIIFTVHKKFKLVVFFSISINNNHASLIIFRE